MGIWEDMLEVIKDRTDIVAELRQVRRGGGKYIVFELCNLTGEHTAKTVVFPGLRSESIYISRGTLRLWPTDENAGMARAEHNVEELAELSRELREKGVDVPEIVYNPHDYRERVKRCQQDGAFWMR